MEVETIAGEVKYSLKIPNLSSYNKGEELNSEFSLSLGGLRSQWQVNIQPFLSKPNKPHHINSNIGITLSCVRSSITRPDIDIYCSVVGRGEEHENKLELVGDDEDEVPPTWQGVLVPRLALHVFDLLPNDQLTAILRFVVRTDDVWRNVDPLEELSVHLRELRKGKYNDVNILTSDGVTIPAHSVILHARSSLWDASQKAGITEDNATSKSQDYLEAVQNHPRTPLTSIFGSDMSSSGFNSLSVNSTGRSASVSSPPGCLGSSLINDRVTSPRSIRLGSSPRHPCTPSHLTGDKRPYSPSKPSPSKRPAPRVIQNSPSQRLKRCENKTPRCQASPLPPKSWDSVNSSTSCSSFSKSPLKELEVNFQRSPAEGHTIQVNMSASVAESMLDWIYTGECSDLEHLARPLLVGGKRYGVTGLVRACEQHLAATLTPATAPHTLLLAHKYSADSLCSATMKYAIAQAKEVTSQPSWATVANRAPDLMTEFSRRLALHSRPGRKR